MSQQKNRLNSVEYDPKKLESFCNSILAVTSKERKLTWFIWVKQTYDQDPATHLKDHGNVLIPKKVEGTMKIN